MRLRSPYGSPRRYSMVLHFRADDDVVGHLGKRLDVTNRDFHCLQDINGELVVVADIDHHDRAAHDHRPMEQALARRRGQQGQTQVPPAD